MTSRKPRLLLCLLALVPTAAAVASTSHAGWPKIDGSLIINRSDADRTIRATKLDRHNELLGGHGNDTIYAGHIGDVLWGDYKPSGQPTKQIDRIHGGPGKDFIYASHGTNYIHAGGGSDQIHVHYGHGAVWCGHGNVTVFISHRNRRHYALHGCHRISYRTVGH